MSKRLPAEWEPQSFVQLTWPHMDSDWADTYEQVLPCFRQIALEISKRQKLLIVCRDIAATKSELGFENENLYFAKADSNDTWARDHGAITVYENNQSVLLDFTFNGWGNKFDASKDNLITQNIKDHELLKSQPLQTVDMVLEGGSIESDGKGMLLTTSQCLLTDTRNPNLRKADIERKLEALLGAKKILWLNHGYLAGDDTDSHIDTLARLAPDNRIVYVKCEDKQDEHFSELAKMEQELRAFTNAENQSFELVPLPMADVVFDDEGQRLPATYANFLIINGAVLMPSYNSAKDSLAANILSQAFPDREIVSINCLPLIYQHGSLHCLTMQFPVLSEHV